MTTAIVAALWLCLLLAGRSSLGTGSALWSQEHMDGQHSSFYSSGSVGSALLCPATTRAALQATSLRAGVVGGTHSEFYCAGTTFLALWNLTTLTHDWTSEPCALSVSVPVFSSASGLLYTSCGSLVAFNGTTGKQVWKFPLEDTGTYLSMLNQLQLSNNMLIVGACSSFGNPCAIMAFEDSLTPRSLWNATITPTTQGPILDIAVSLGGTVYAIIGAALNSVKVIALDGTSGATLWQTSFTNSKFGESLLVRGDGNIVWNYNNQFSILNQENGTVITTQTNSAVKALTDTYMVVARTSVMGGLVITNETYVLYYNGTLGSHFTLTKNVTNAQVAIDGSVAIYVTGQSGSSMQLEAFAIGTGERLWNTSAADTHNDNRDHLHVAIVGDGSLLWMNSWGSFYIMKSCGNHGTCNSGDKICSCDNYWNGTSCSVCTRNCGHGICTEDSTCNCHPNWAGEECTVCAEWWEGDNCEICTKTCSGRGVCRSDGICKCHSETFFEYHGEDCSKQRIDTDNLVLGIVGGIIFFAAVGGLITCFAKKKQDNYESIRQETDREEEDD